MSYVDLKMTDAEARDVHHAIAVAVTLLDAVGADVPDDAALTPEARPRLTQVARRLDHERRWKGRQPNPNGPKANA